MARHSCCHCVLCRGKRDISIGGHLSVSTIAFRFPSCSPFRLLLLRPHCLFFFNRFLKFVLQLGARLTAGAGFLNWLHTDTLSDLRRTWGGWKEAARHGSVLSGRTSPPPPPSFVGKIVATGSSPGLVGLAAAPRLLRIVPSGDLLPMLPGGGHSRSRVLSI